jgi:hypothetical protein
MRPVGVVLLRGQSPGQVEVTNESHENPADHQYTVSIDGVTHERMACTCPHHIHCTAYCKHMAAVAERNGSHEIAAFNTNSDNLSDSPRQFIVVIIRSGDLWLGGGKMTVLPQSLTTTVEQSRRGDIRMKYLGDTP